MSTSTPPPDVLPLLLLKPLLLRLPPLGMIIGPLIPPPDERLELLLLREELLLLLLREEPLLLREEPPLDRLTLPRLPPPGRASASIGVAIQSARARRIATRSAYAFRCIKTLPPCPLVMPPDDGRFILS